MSTVSLTQKRREELALLIRRNLWLLAQVLLDAEEFLDPVHRLVCRFLQGEGKRKALVLPRGHLKSSICSFVYPIWRAINNVNIRILITTNSFTNAKKFIGQIRGAFDSNELFRAIFPELLPDGKNHWSDESACILRARQYQESTFEAAGTGTSVVSRHYDIIIEDDTIAPKKDKLTENELLPSQDDIAKAIGWHKLAYPLLVNPKSSEILVPTTRWTYYDLINHIKTTEREHYKILDIPCRLPSGKPIHPKRFDDETLKQLRASLGRYFFGALYENNPVPDEQMTFQPRWFREFTGEPEYERKIIIIDPAIGTSVGACFTAIMGIGLPKSGSLHIDWYKQGHWQEHEITKEVFTAVREFKPDSVGVEGVLFARLFKNIFEAKMEKENLYFAVDLLDPKQKDKDLRIRGVQPLMEYGRIFMRAGMTELQNQLVQFPFTKFKDLLDCLAYACEYTHPEYRQAEPKKVEAPIFEKDGKLFIRGEAILDDIRSRHVGALPFDYQLGGKL